MTPGSKHLANNPRLFEVQRANNFELQVMDIDDLVAIDQTLLDDETRNLKNGGEILRLACDESSVPSFSQKVIDIHYGNNAYHFAGKPTFKNHEIKVIDYIGANSKGILLAWQKKSYDVRTENIGRAAEYKKTAYLVEKTPDDEVVRTWTLHGCWIQNLDHDNFQQSSDNAKVMNCTIVYDYFTIDD